jgi:hypothetical protein
MRLAKAFDGNLCRQYPALHFVCLIFLCLIKSSYSNYATETENSAISPFDEDRELFPPELSLTLLNGGDKSPPLTHHIDIEVRSFDPADGYLEIYSGSKMLKRILDPPPSEVFSVYVSSYSCFRPSELCRDHYTVKLFSFKSKDPLVTAHVEYEIQGSEFYAGTLDSSGEAKPKLRRDILQPEVARSVWPLPCDSVVPFPGFPFPSAFVERPIIFHAYPPHGNERTKIYYSTSFPDYLFIILPADLGWMHFDPAAVLKCAPSCLWLVELSCPEAADVVIFSCGYSQGRFGAGAPRVSKLPHQIFLHLCMESTSGRVDEGFMAAMDLVSTFQLASHVPILYVPGNLSLFTLAPVRHKTKLAMFVISHCGLERDLYLRQLMQHMQATLFRCQKLIFAQLWLPFL